MKGHVKGRPAIARDSNRRTTVAHDLDRRDVPRDHVRGRDRDAPTDHALTVLARGNRAVHGLYRSRDEPRGHHVASQGHDGPKARGRGRCAVHDAPKVHVRGNLAVRDSVHDVPRVRDWNHDHGNHRRGWNHDHGNHRRG